LWSKILEKIPDATLVICTYNEFPKNDEEKEMEKIINKYKKSITHFGKLNQKELYYLMSSCEYCLWGRKLVSGRNVLPFGEILEINKSLFSFNNRYAMTINNNGIIYVYDRNSGNIIYFLNRNPTAQTQGMIIETTSIQIEYIDMNGNRKSKSILSTSFIDDCGDCNKPPFNVILDDTNGMMVIYANSFLNVTNKDFKSFLNKEMEYMNDLRKRGMGADYNINSQRFQEITGRKIEEVPREEEYIWRT